MKAKGFLRLALARPLRWGVSKVRGRKRGPRGLDPEAVNRQPPVVIAHRGFSAFAPENTLPAFKLALDAGVDFVELDYRRSADGQLMVIHDADLDRTTDARQRWGGHHIKVEARSATELRSLDAGGWFDARFAGTQVPLLSEALELIAPRAVALLERKSGDVESTIRALESKRLIGRVVVQSFDWSFLRALHERVPQQPLAALGPLARLPGVRHAPGVFSQLTGRWLKAVRKIGAKVVVWNKQISPAAVRLAHQQGLSVWIYTINRAELAERLLDFGVDGIITNNPALVWKTMALRRERSRPSS